MKRILAIVPRLALCDLRHEWVLSLCLMVALASVIAPLLILMGLKNGTIKTLRQRLVEDPAFRQIRPIETREYPGDWFKTLSRDKRVGFLIPTILPAASTVLAIDTESNKSVVVDIVPTGKGDPLLGDADIAVPDTGQCVLSFGASRDLHLKTGQTVRLKVSRYRKGRYEYGYQDCVVIGVLPKKAGMLPVIYTPLQFVLDVEAYKEGKAVPTRGWKGSFARPYLRFDAILVVSKVPLDPMIQNALLIESGLANIKQVQSENINWLPGWHPSGQRYLYLLSIPGSTFGLSSYYAVKNRLRGSGAITLPINNPQKLAIGRETLITVGLSVNKDVAKKLEILPTPWGTLKKKRTNKELLQIILPDKYEDRFVNDQKIMASFKGQGELEFPLLVAGFHQQTVAIIPLELSAILRTSQTRRVIFDSINREFILGDMGFRGFRLYAASIDDVESLYNFLKSQGIPVVAQIEAIQRIKTLDSGLSRLLFLVAFLGISGAILVLIASLYAAVERKRSELAIMRLLGFSRFDIFFFPIYQSLFLAGGACIVALLGYNAFAWLINLIFKSEMKGEEAICSLPPSILGWSVAITLVLAISSSLVGARRTTNIDPAEAIRAE